MLSRFTPYFVAAALPLLVFAWFMPKGAVQIDLWLLWFVAMTVVALPMLFLELALASRSGQTPWQGMQKLTREADVGVFWRLFVGLGVFFAILLATRLLGVFAEGVGAYTQALGLTLSMPSYVVAGVLTGVALILSVLKERLLGVGAVLVLISGVLMLVLTPHFSFAVTPTNIQEWGLAVVMALFSVGVGTGVYWFSDKLHMLSTQRPANAPLSRVVLPIWLAQLVFGVFAFLTLSTTPNAAAVLVGGVGVLLVSAFLLYYAGSQLMARFGMITGGVITVVAAIVLALLPSALSQYLLVVIGLIVALGLAIFAGWLMKISHLRKVLNFGSELRYNLWRVAVRILVPLSIMSGLVGWVLLWLT